MKGITTYITRGSFAAAALLLISGAAHAASTDTGTTTLGVTVGAEAAFSVTTANTSLTTTGTVFGNPYTGTTNFTYKVRTSQTNGAGTVTLKVTSDFNPLGVGPSVLTPVTPGDALQYSCTAGASATACSTGQTASTTASTNVATFGADVHSGSAGDSGSVAWTLTNDPVYKTGSYTATVTFTISVT
jgi:hypothetical protein